MNSNLPPLPWSYETNDRVGAHEGYGFVYLLDANGRKIGTFWGRPDEKIAIAQLVVEASEAIAIQPGAGGHPAPSCPAKLEERSRMASATSVLGGIDGADAVISRGGE